MTTDDALLVIDASPTFDVFYRTTYPTLVRALVVGLGDYDRGVDAADEAMARAYPKWAEIRDYDNPEGWCFRVGLNFGRSRLRRLTRRPPAPTVDWTDDQLPNPELWDALQALDRELRDVVVCRLLLDMSSKATATHLHLSEGTVKSRLHRAKTQLKQALAPASASPEGTDHD